MLRNLQIERILGDWVRKSLPSSFTELIMFFLKQAWASLFGLIFLIVIIITSIIWQDDWALHRYDALFIFAITTQILFLIFKLESLNEAKVILLFHIVGTVMERVIVKSGV